MHHSSFSTPNKFIDQYKKIFCAYHKAEFLTNFCVDKNCLMPLCPSCIVDHTEQHYRQNSKPLYMNLHQALHDVKESCMNNISQYQNFAQRLRQTSGFKKRLVQQVHSQLVQHKQNIYMNIQRLFMQFENELYKLIVKDYEQQGLYRQDDILQYQYKVQDTINQLYDKIGLLKGQQCLGTLIMYYGEDRDRITEAKNECEKFIYRHDNLKIQTNLNQIAMKKQFQNLFQNVIQIMKGNKLQRSRKSGSKTPQKNNLNRSISQSRRSKIFYPQNSKIISPRNPPLENSIRKQKANNNYGSAFR